MAEDNPDDVLITKRAWKKGMIKNELHVVKDGEEALDFLYRRGNFSDAPRPCLMLLDLKMPKMDGFQVLETIKKDPSLKKLPVVVLTTSNRDRDIERAYELGCNSYITKPVGFDNFLKAVIDIQRFWLVICELPSIY
jgi:two-component system response regulator